MNINPREVLQQGLLLVPEGAPRIVTDPTNKECQIQANGVDLRIAETLILAPGTCANVQILERFVMRDAFGAIWIRSSLSRKGVFLSSGLFDVGFGVGVDGGSIGGVTLYNMSKDQHIIHQHMRFCQMVFFPCCNTNVGNVYNGYYNKNQTIESQLKGGVHGSGNGN